ncbi:hypothetical protein TNCV_973861 [Trichonephila clavipes]|nr:hypothetical protein TNCV_973861 [Trichonephila clavipes]
MALNVRFRENRSGSRHLRTVSQISSMNSYSNEKLVDLIAKTSMVYGRIRGLPGIFENARNSIQRHCQAFQTASGHKFEHLL